MKLDQTGDRNAGRYCGACIHHTHDNHCSCTCYLQSADDNYQSANQEFTRYGHERPCNCECYTTVAMVTDQLGGYTPISDSLCATCEHALPVAQLTHVYRCLHEGLRDDRRHLHTNVGECPYYKLCPTKGLLKLAYHDMPGGDHG